MKVEVHMEIETTDYGKKEFKKEIEKLIENIDSDAKLLKFEMHEKYAW